GGAGGAAGVFQTAGAARRTSGRDGNFCRSRRELVPAGRSRASFRPVRVEAVTHEQPTGEMTYDPISRGLHWVNAMLTATAVLLAWGISGAPRHSGARDWLIALHGSLGLVILLLMLFWLGWRLSHTAPPLRPVLTGIEILLARATHLGLQLLFVLMPLSGYVSLAAAGRPLSFFGI